MGGFPPAFGGDCVLETLEEKGSFLVPSCHQLGGSVLSWHAPTLLNFHFTSKTPVGLPCALLFPCVQTLRLIESQVFVFEAEDWIHCILF